MKSQFDVEGSVLVIFVEIAVYIVSDFNGRNCLMHEANLTNVLFSIVNDNVDISFYESVSDRTLEKSLITNSSI